MLEMYWPLLILYIIIPISFAWSGRIFTRNIIVHNLNCIKLQNGSLKWPKKLPFAKTAVERELAIFVAYLVNAFRL